MLDGPFHSISSFISRIFSKLNHSKNFTPSYIMVLSQCLNPPDLIIWRLLTSHSKPFSTITANVLSLCHVCGVSPGTFTSFPTYTSPSTSGIPYSYCLWVCLQSHQLFTAYPNDFYRPVIASCFLQPQPHVATLIFGCPSLLPGESDTCTP